MAREAEKEPGHDPEARQRERRLQEEHQGEDQQERAAPAAGQTGQPADRKSKRRHAVALQGLKQQDRNDRDRDRDGIIERVTRRFALDIGVVQRDADRREQQKLDRSHDADEHHARKDRLSGFAGELGEQRRSARHGDRAASSRWPMASHLACSEGRHCPSTQEGDCRVEVEPTRSLRRDRVIASR